MRGEVVALVAQDADEFGCQRIVEQLHDVLAPRAETRRDGTFIETRRCGVDCVLVKNEALACFLDCGVHEGSFRGSRFCASAWSPDRRCPRSSPMRPARP